jgi:hypothetical protein
MKDLPYADDSLASVLYMKMFADQLGMGHDVVTKEQAITSCRHLHTTVEVNCLPADTLMINS